MSRVTSSPSIIVTRVDDITLYVNRFSIPHREVFEKFAYDRMFGKDIISDEVWLINAIRSCYPNASRETQTRRLMEAKDVCLLRTTQDSDEYEFTHLTYQVRIIE